MIRQQFGPGYVFMEQKTISSRNHYFLSSQNKLVVGAVSVSAGLAILLNK
jgi:hypothetical protein